MKPNLKRLRKLGQALVDENIAHDRFNYEVLNQLWDSSLYDARCSDPKLAARGCGTEGCAAGQLPYLFPRHWQWTGDGRICLKYSSEDWENDCEEFFQIPHSIVRHLFQPEAQMRGRKLPNGARVKTVGKHILRFCDEVQQGVWKHKLGELS